MNPDMTFQPERQDQLTQQLIKSATESGRNMLNYMDSKLPDADHEVLKYCNIMLEQLRTIELSPQKYYQLYLRVSEDMQYLKLYLEENKVQSLDEVYQSVQYATNVLPRMYMLCTVGAVAIKSGQMNIKNLLVDLVEMCKGVQHPLKGLFLRAYLCQIMRGLLPGKFNKEDNKNIREQQQGNDAQQGSANDTDTPEGEQTENDANKEAQKQETDLLEGTINDSIEFLLNNFTEMNKLWIRMQFQGTTRDIEKREKERRELADLMGKNLVQLSQLEDLDFSLYDRWILPKLMEQVISCKDVIAQGYLMEGIIQCFPDEFHLMTLQVLLGACPELQQGVKVHQIMASLMQRLANFAKSNESMLKKFVELNTFNKFKTACEKITESHLGLSKVQVMELYEGLINLACQVHPNDLPCINNSLSSCKKALETASINDRMYPQDESKLLQLLSIPLQRFNPVQLLEMSAYPKLMVLLNNEMYSRLAIKILETMLSTGTIIDSVAQVDMLFKFLQPLVLEDSNKSQEDVDVEQNLIARIIHCLKSKNQKTQIQILEHTFQNILPGGPGRWVYTLTPILYSTLQLVKDVQTSGNTQKATQNAVPQEAVNDGDNQQELENGNTEKIQETTATDAPETESQGVSMVEILQFLLKLTQYLADTNQNQATFRMLIQCAYIASQVAKSEEFAYDFFEQAFDQYDFINHRQQQKTCLYALIGVLQQCTVFSAENQEALLHRTASYTSKLTKKEDKCYALCACSHLFWQQGEDKDNLLQDSSKVFEQLGRAERLARNSLNISVQLNKKLELGPFVEILNHRLFYINNGLASKEQYDSINGLINTIEEMSATQKPLNEASVMGFYQNTLNHIRYKKASKSEVYNTIYLPQQGAKLGPESKRRSGQPLRP